MRRPPSGLMRSRTPARRSHAWPGMSFGLAGGGRRRVVGAADFEGDGAARRTVVVVFRTVVVVTFFGTAVVGAGAGRAVGRGAVVAGAVVALVMVDTGTVASEVVDLGRRTAFDEPPPSLQPASSADPASSRAMVLAVRGRSTAVSVRVGPLPTGAGKRRPDGSAPAAVGGPGAGGFLVEALREVQALEHELDGAGHRGRALVASPASWLTGPRRAGIDSTRRT